MKILKVMLLKPHRHEGEQRNIGDSLSVNVTLAGWLVSRNIAKLVDETVKDKGEKQ